MTSIDEEVDCALQSEEGKLQSKGPNSMNSQHCTKADPPENNVVALSDPERTPDTCQQEREEGEVSPERSEPRSIGAADHVSDTTELKVVINDRIEAKKFADEAMDEDTTHLGPRLVFFTDGSLTHRGNVGGAGITYKRCIGGISKWIDESFAIVGAESSYQAELIAVDSAVSIALHEMEVIGRCAFESSDEKQPAMRIFIITDSQSVLLSIRKHINGDCANAEGPGPAIYHHPAFGKLANRLGSLARFKVNIEFHWTKGHSGVEGNGRADTLARSAVSWYLRHHSSSTPQDGYELLRAPTPLISCPTEGKRGRKRKASESEERDNNAQRGVSDTQRAAWKEAAKERRAMKKATRLIARRKGIEDVVEPNKVVSPSEIRTPPRRPEREQEDMSPFRGYPSCYRPSRRSESEPPYKPGICAPLSASARLQPGPEHITMSSKESEKPLTVRCQCGTVSFPTPTAKPTALYHCHCTECQKQSASAFGTSAIFESGNLFPLAPDLKARLGLYTRPTDRGSMDCYFCRACGSRLFHRIRDTSGAPRPTVSVKGGCVEGLDWSGGVHIYMRSAVMKIPREWEQYETVPPSMNCIPWALHWRSNTFFILATVAVGLFTSLFLYGLVVPALPFMLRERLAIPEEETQSYVSGLLAAYAGASLLFALVAGWVADRTNARQAPFLGCLAALLVATIMLAFGQSITLIVVARVLQGVTAAVFWRRNESPSQQSPI
ncbi:hypothetical protein DL771_005411 [Monosporascus sp. 5C6A]|nr:hypothetical protein DL771_005411 [Monosporascus sp. 5C6A]